MDSTPTVSVVMPAHNAEKFISQAIESMLSQTFDDFECIIIDDSSHDSTWSVITEYSKSDSRIVGLRNDQNLKLSKTLNRGISIAKGQYVARMDADDIAHKNRFEKQVDFLRACPDTGIIGGSMEIFDESGVVVGYRRYNLTDEAIRKKIFRYSPFCHPAIMVRKSVLDKVGYYRHEFNPAEDYELYFRIGQVSKFANLNDVLLSYRIVGHSMTHAGTKNMELKTIQIRRIYSRSKYYAVRPLDKIYNTLHAFSLYVVPSSVRTWIFYKLRNSNAL